MRHIRTFLIGAAALALPFAASLLPAGMPFASAAQAQQSPGFFVPNQAPAAGPGPRVAPTPQAPAGNAAAPRPGPGPRAPAPLPQQAQGFGPGEDLPELPPVPLPPPPELPALAKGTAAPIPSLGVLGVPEIMRASTAAQSVERAVEERRRKVAEDAQKEQAALRELEAALGNDRAKLTPEQQRNRERELRERIINAQRVFRERSTNIQQAAQYGIAQIEQTLVSVIRQVAESRGMNMVLHRSQVALNINEFDITDLVVEQLNKVLPSVLIPPDGANIPDFAKKNAPATPAAAAAPAPTTPATQAAPVSPTPAKQ